MGTHQGKAAGGAAHIGRSKSGELLNPSGEMGKSNGCDAIGPLGSKRSKPGEGGSDVGTMAIGGGPKVCLLRKLRELNEPQYILDGVCTRKSTDNRSSLLDSFSHWLLDSLTP